MKEIMTFYKIWFHLIAILKMVFYKCLYGSKLMFGKGVTWRSRFYIMLDKKANVKIGDNCFFNNDCSITAINSVVIGDGCLFGENVKIYDHNHRFSNLDLPIKEQGYSISGVRIGKHCWIGSNVCILKGAEIGDNCVIGAGCVISGKIDDNTIVRPSYDYLYQKIEGMNNE